MAVRETVQIGHPALKAKNNRITDFKSEQLRQLIQDLKDTMYDNGLIGIAAPQIAENFTVFVTEPRETKTRPKDQADIFRVYINPVIVDQSEEEIIIYEGCGSLLHGQLFGPVRRPRQITVEAYDEEGQKFRFTADGILGRVMQHEYDHLQGIEFTEKITDYKKLMYVDFYIKNIKNSPEQLAAGKITVKNFEKVNE